MRERILSGELRPGMTLVQTEWAEQLGTSRMPVRDAFLRLQAEGMLVPAENGVARVVALSEVDIRDGYELTAFACGIATTRAAEIMPAEALDRLQNMHEAYVAALLREDLEVVYEQNHAFHRLINVHSGSPRLLVMLRTLTAGLPRVGTRWVAGWRERTVETHERVLAALRVRDGDTAAELRRRHIFEAADLAVDYLRAHGYWDGPTTGDLPGGVRSVPESALP